jgi:hypothetical protein
MEEALFGDDTKLYGQIFEFYDSKIKENTLTLLDLEGRKEYGEQVKLL